MSDFDEDVQKQRRNLLLISIALLIFDFAEVSIAKVGILGTDLIIGNPAVLIATAWIFWLYFLIRYFQYWRMHSAQRVSSTYYQYLESWSTSYLAKRYEADVTRRRLAMNYIRARRFEVVERKANILAAMDETLVERFSWWRTTLVKCRAAWHVAVVSPHFTDQMFPFVLASLAPIVTIATKWHSLKGIVA